MALRLHFLFAQVSGMPPPSVLINVYSRARRSNSQSEAVRILRHRLLASVFTTSYFVPAVLSDIRVMTIFCFATPLHYQLVLLDSHGYTAASRLLLLSMLKRGQLFVEPLFPRAHATSTIGTIFAATVRDCSMCFASIVPKSAPRWLPPSPASRAQPAASMSLLIDGAASHPSGLTLVACEKSRGLGA